MTDDRRSTPGDDAEKETSGELTKRTGDRNTAAAEWITLAISTAILIAMVSAITWLSFKGDDHPPVIVVEVELHAVRSEESGYYLPVTIHNEGDHTVEDVVVQGTLVTDDGEPETADITISFLSAGEEVRGTMVFRSDPAGGDLTTGVTSYKDP